MAVDPSQVTKSEAANVRYLKNEATTLLQLKDGDAKTYLVQSASRLVRDCPPALPWACPFNGKTYRGLFYGPTSVAYFFFLLSVDHDDLEIEGCKPKEWCRAYLELAQDDFPPMLDESCGIVNEHLASHTLKACFYQDESHAKIVLTALRSLETDVSYAEWLRGRAGALYLLRILRRWLPGLADEIKQVSGLLIEVIMAHQPWSWNGRAYIGPVHGDVGIMTQVVLSDPSRAPELETKLLELLGLQGEEGNWPVIPDKEIGLVQFCHGAPGMVVSLLALKPYFPKIQAQIDAGIDKGRKWTWERGILVKEPNICHGITGNALALDKAQRDHFLSLATPQRVWDGVADGIFEKDAEGVSLLWGEAGRAWVWMEVWDGREGRVALYTDI